MQVTVREFTRKFPSYRRAALAGKEVRVRDRSGKSFVFRAVEEKSASLAEVAHVSLICPPDEARRRLKRVEQLGFDEILLVSQTGALDEIERARDFL